MEPTPLRQQHDKRAAAVPADDLLPLAFDELSKVAGVYFAGKLDVNSNPAPTQRLSCASVRIPRAAT